MAKNKLEDLIQEHQAEGYSYTGRPPDDIDPRLKDKAWILKNCKAIYHDFNRNSPELFYNGSNKYNSILGYVQGNQSIRKYQERYDQNKSVTEKQTTVNHDKKPLNLISKYFRLILNKLRDIEYVTTATPNNSLARDHEEEYRNKMTLFMQMQQIMRDNNFEMSAEFLSQQGFEIPRDTEELEIAMQMSQPARFSMELEMALSWINYLDRSEDKVKEADYPLVAFGMTALKSYMDANNIPRTEYVDVRDLLVGYSATEDFRDIQEVGQFRMATMQDIRIEDRMGNLSKDDLERIAVQFKGKYGNTAHGHDIDNRFLYPGNEDLYSKERVLICDIYFFSFDEHVKLIKKDRNGNKRIYSKDFDYYRGNEDEFNDNNPDKKLKRTRIKNVYKATWIVDSNYIYNFGLLRPTERTNSDPNDTQLPIQLEAPLMQDSTTVSLIEEMIPIENYANLMWQRMQEHIAQAPPPGFQFDVDALKNAIQGLPGLWKNEKEVFELMKKHNIIPTSNKELSGAANGARPFMPLDGGLGAGFMSYVEGLNYAMTLLQEISGFSNVAAGTDVKYTGKKTAEMATLTADYSIKHLFRAKKNIYERHMQSKSRLLMDSISKGNVLGFKRSFGKLTESTIRIDKNVTLYDYNIKIEFRPNKQEWADLNEKVSIALAQPLEQGGITMAEAMRIEECENLKQARELLYLFYKKNRKAAQEYQLQLQQEKAAADQETAMVASQQAAQGKQIEADQEIRVEQAKSDLRMKEAEQNFIYSLELEKMKGLVGGDHLEKKRETEVKVNKIKVDGNISRNKPSVTQTGGK